MVDGGGIVPVATVVGGVVLEIDSEVVSNGCVKLLIVLGCDLAHLD